MTPEKACSQISSTALLLSAKASLMTILTLRIFTNNLHCMSESFVGIELKASFWSERSEIGPHKSLLSDADL